MEPADPVDSASTPPRRSWRKRHPVLARIVLYGGAVAVLAGGTAIGLSLLEASRQQSLITRIQGADGMLRDTDAERALAVLDREVLAQRPSDDTRRRALLSRAAALDALKRYDESEATYAGLVADWPVATPRGPLFVPWANMRVSAGKAARAADLLRAPGTSDGMDPETVAMVRKRIADAIGGGLGNASSAPR